MSITGHDVKRIHINSDSPGHHTINYDVSLIELVLLQAFQLLTLVTK